MTSGLEQGVEQASPFFTLQVRRDRR